MEKAEKVILDVDTGIDDAVAIILAARSPEIELRGITTVAGNVDVNKTTRNTLRILEFLGREDISVARGMSKPIIGELKTSEFIHGKDGLGDVDLRDPKIKAISKHAMDFIIEELNSSKRKELSIVATGPLTNIAMVLLKEPDLAKKINKLVSMGGAFGVTRYGCGNETSTAEFNIYSDPVAAKIVYGSGADVYAFGLDVTMNPYACIDEETYNWIGKIKTRTANLLHRMFRELIKVRGVIAMHDPMALSFIISHDMFKFQRFHVDVELTGAITKGQTIVERRQWFLNIYKRIHEVGVPEEIKRELEYIMKKPVINVCIEADSKRFLNLLIKRTVLEEV